MYLIGRKFEQPTCKPCERLEVLRLRPRTSILKEIQSKL
jgi:hypothetical protein